MHDGFSGSALAVRVVPDSTSTTLAGVLEDGTVIIRLTNAADDKALNQSLLIYLCSILEIPLKDLDIAAGEKGNEKLVSIINLDAHSVQERILQLKSSPS
jgi:uncharacterized protein YggU (UPF0235/DUF167 family)